MKLIQTNIQMLVYLAGLAQIALALGSLVVPGALKWRAELMKVQPMIKQLFWVYASYIFVVNNCFGLISFFAPADLTNGTTLATALTGFIAAYWISRVLIQFFYFDRTNFPQGTRYRIGEFILVTLFFLLSGVYCVAFYINFMYIQA